ncbi:hypothetical protein BHE74_00058095, partial [Ensete ventricosum]
MISEPRLFMQKIDFKLCVKRLDCVELFYALLLYFRSEGTEERGRPTTARPLQGQPQEARPQGQRPPMTSPQGVGAHRGAAYGHRQRPPMGIGSARLQGRRLRALRSQVLLPEGNGVCRRGNRP